MAFQNDPVFQANDRLLVYKTAVIASLAEHPTALGDHHGSPRVATVVREHPSEPGTLEVAYDDGGSELISDQQRLRHAWHEAERLAKAAAVAQAAADEAKQAAEQ